MKNRAAAFTPQPDELEAVKLLRRVYNADKRGMAAGGYGTARDHRAMYAALDAVAAYFSTQEVDDAE